MIRRATQRSPTEAAISCRPYFGSGLVHSVEGIMRNFSTRGSYVETPRRFEPGTILVVRMLRYPSVISAPDGTNQPRTICLAKVIWGHELSEGDRNRYGMGLKYLD